MNTEKCKYCGGSGKILMLFNYVDCECLKTKYNWIEGRPNGTFLEYWNSHNVISSPGISSLLTLEKWNTSLYLVIWMHAYNEEQKRYYCYLSEFSEENRKLYSEKIKNKEIKWLTEPLDTKI